MIKTPNLKLPIYNAPTTDVFNLEEWNEANNKLDSAYKEIVDFRTEIPKVNANAELVEARMGETTLGANINRISSSLEHITTNPTFLASTNTESALLGNELINSTGWTVPSGWTGDFANGFKNTVGNLNPLTFTIGEPTGTKLYQVSFRVESPTPAGEPNASTDFIVKIGNSVEFVTYQGGGNFNYTFGIQSVSDGNLIFAPNSTFDGTIKNVSVKEIVGAMPTTLKIKDNSNNSKFELRTSKGSLNNLFLGKQNGQYNTTGHGNSGFGDLALSKNTTGYWNSAIGRQALEENTVGSRNVSVGYLALRHNISGDRNIAIGTFTLEGNTTGRQNIGMGADTLWVNTTGSRNIALGMASMPENTTGNENVAIGYTSLGKNISGNNNIAIGFDSLRSNTVSSFNVAIGRESLKNCNTSAGSINTAVGYASLSKNTTGFNNVSFGHNSMVNNTTGYENTAIGVQAGNNSNGNQNTFVGTKAGIGLTTSNNNTMIGYNAGSNITTGVNNIMIGRNTVGVSETSSNEVNIGGVFRGYSNSKKATIGDDIASPTARLHLPAGTATFGTAPLKFTSGALMTSAESGAIEFDGGNLYFTIAGVRKVIQLV